MKYDFEPGTVLKDRTFGIEWIVTERIPGGVRIRVNRKGGAYANATDKTCHMMFSVVKS